MKGRSRLVAVSAVAAAASLVLAACSSSKSSSPSSSSGAPAANTSAASASAGAGGAAGGKIQAALILKEFTNPYWISMENAAKAEAAKLGVDLHVSAGKADDDATSQIQQIDAAISAGYKGIIIAINSDAVNTALQRAKAAGLLVVVVDTPPIPASIADVTYATDNLQAGLFIGKWMAQKLNGANADIAMLDDLANQVITVDVDRDHGFLQGMGIPVGNPNVNGQEPKSGHYTGGKGGSYKIACQLPTNGSATGGLSAMETCLSKDPNINVVYTINEPAAKGAAQALKNAGKTPGKDVTIVTIDGSCNYLSLLTSGEIGADSGQFPGKMAQLGVDAIAQFAKTGAKPSMPAGKDFINTGVQLITAQPQPGVDSVTPDQAKSSCWG
jgi:fructose transport system substrate-binding protein